MAGRYKAGLQPATLTSWRWTQGVAPGWYEAWRCPGGEECPRVATFYRLVTFPCSHGCRGGGNAHGLRRSTVFRRYPRFAIRQIPQPNHATQWQSGLFWGCAFRVSAVEGG